MILLYCTDFVFLLRHIFMFETPILFLIFNRPEPAFQVFEQIKKIQPKCLYIAADGPRKDKKGEAVLCIKTRAVVQQIDWDCEVKTLFREENLGCGNAVYSAINWFFDDVEQGIILEDDCLPDLSFFPFCETLLNRYKGDSDVMHISGTNSQFGRIVGDGSYYFSKFARIWGWATWRRAWEKIDFDLNNLDNYLDKEKGISDYWKENLINTKNGKTDTWDFQWIFTVWLLNGKTISPNVSLVRNIGYNEDATHTQKAHWWLSRIIYGSIKNIIHPSTTEINTKADDFLNKIVSNIPLTLKEKIFLRFNRLKYKFFYKNLCS